MKYNDRFIYIMQDFTDNLAQQVIKHLFELDNKNRRDITLIINSGGGDTDALFAIHDTMKMLRSDVATLCIGRAYSSAACLLVSGEKGKRFITPTSDVMFHEISSGVEGKISNMEDEMVSMKHYEAMMQKIVQANIGIPYHKILRKRRESYYNADQALKIGAVDKIVNSIDEVINILNPQV